jgi:hypothetical protein
VAAKQKSKSKQKRKRTPTTDPAQSARFLETAKNLGVDESGGAFEKALDVLVPKQRGKKPPDTT